MSLIEQKAFNDILKMAQTLLRRRIEKSGEVLTPDLIDQELQKLEILMFEEFGIVNREELIDELIRRSSHGIGKSATLSSGEDHVPWLVAERKSDWRYWRRYSEHLETQLPLLAVEELDRATDEVLGNLEDPNREGAWDRRGLVVGHVQSGKTGNYTGLICKAADAGYKIIIVLAGLHNNLRSQTQIRLDEGFLGYATLANVDELPLTGVGELDNDPHIRPNCATNRSDRGDFDKATARKLAIKPEERPWLFVVKKNKTVLERLLYWVQNHAYDMKDPETGRRLVSKLPLLIIDDESDHGSVDTGEKPVDEFGQPDLEHEPTTINRLIRQLLHSFTKKAYVGYTATPFANIFIHDRGATDEHGPDLFPSAFITNLAAPTNYVGPGRVFGSSSSAAEELPLIRPLEDDYLEWMPQRHKNGHLPRISGEARLPDSLQEAIRSFIYACAVRKIRGQGRKHSSMLIHVSRFTSVQSEIVAQVSQYVNSLRRRFVRRIDLAETESLMRYEFENEYMPSMQRIREAFSEDEECDIQSWADIQNVLPEVLEDIDVKEINGSAKEALDYADNDATGLKVIAIGGDKLARGLTLEGLCTSYFLRTAKMYDTLMQMGRWFGYRDRYLDVCRLYTTHEMIQWFGHIADAAEELRQEFDNMVAAGMTPKDFGLRVKSHSILTVTSRAKMKSAKPIRLTFSGDLLQTITFPLDKDELLANLQAGDVFVESLGDPIPLTNQAYDPGLHRWNGHLWRSIQSSKVIEFLRNYRTHPSSFRVVSPLIAEFIEEMNKDSELTNWTVALVGTGGKDAIRTLAGLEVNMLQRKSSAKHEDRFSIKTLISSWDQSIDLSEAQWRAALQHSHKTWRNDRDRNEGAKEPEEPKGPAIRHILGPHATDYGLSPATERGLLLLYLVNPDPAKSGEARLNGAEPILAWAISLPGSSSSRTVSNAGYMANSVFWGGLNDFVD